jgi:hypothetical protein
MPTRAELDLFLVLTGKSPIVSQLTYTMVLPTSALVVCRESFALVTVFRRLLSTIHLSKLQPSIVTGDISPACGIYVFHSTCLCNSHTSTSGLKDRGLEIKADTLYRYLTSFAWQHSFPPYSPFS